MKLSLIIPCYNEEEGLYNLKDKLIPVLSILKNSYQVELIFIDDGSTDRTNELLHQLFGNLDNVKIIKHEKNKNLGGAMRTGFANCTGDIVVTMDSDCTYPPSEIIPMLSMLDEKTDIITASPYHPKGKVENIPEYRLLLSKSISLLYRIVTKAKIYTFTALFRAQRREVVNNIKFDSNNFLATAEMLIYAHMNGYKIKEYPTILHVRQYGVSKMKLFKVINSHTRFLMRLLAIRLGFVTLKHKV